MNSLWLSSTGDFKINKTLDKNYITDVCIIGSGICGLSVAYYLTKLGLNVVVVDKSNIGEKVSGHTTAKITLQHGLIYDYLINTFGLEYASKYFESNKKAILNIKEIIDSENIDCNFEFMNNYIYASEQKDLVKIHNEIKAINTLEGFSKNIHFDYRDDIVNTNCSKKSCDYAYFTADCGLPFKNFGAIMTKNQAQFHPRKYMIGLVNSILKNKGIIFTNTLIKDVQKRGSQYVSLSDNYSIHSKYVVIASHYPFINFPGLYFSKMYQSTSYAIAIETKEKLMKGMYINAQEPTLSFRTAKNDGKELLIVSGGNHKTGYSPDSDSNFGYSFLEKEIKKYYSDYKILYKWNSRDCITLDKIPYIGEFSTLFPNMYVATGFNKWGMTSSNVAANIITGEIAKGKNNSFKNYRDVYTSTRFSPIKNRTEVKNMVEQTFKSFISNRIKIPEESLNNIAKDNGAIIRINGTPVGIYKSSDNKIFAVNPTCTHLGCLLTWNNLDKTWDCPCHGSRFDYRGKNLYDPAFNDLETY